MVCTVVKTACISLQDHSKHLLVHCNSMNSGQFQQFKARKHELLDCDSPSFADMRALIITEQTFSPTSLRLAAANSLRPPAPTSFLFRRNGSSGRRSLWDFSPCEGQLPLKLLILFGFLLCFSFILAICTLDASVRLHAGKSGRPVQERRVLMGFHLDNPHKAVNGLGQRIEHLHHSYVGDPIKASTTQNHEAALHGLGTVFSKGTKSMPNLIIANLEESLDVLDFRLFLRTLYRSGSMAKADLVLLFPGSSLPQEVARVLAEEENSFKKLLKSSTPSSNSSNMSTFDANAFKGFSSDAKSPADKKRSIMWGEDNTFYINEESQYEYGSVVGFLMNDLDPADGFSEFLISPPSQLRRWICYQMLLGLLRFKFRQVMLVDLGGVVILDDVFSPGRKRDFLYLSLEDSSWADTLTVDSSQQQSSQAEERQGPLAKISIQDDDQVVASNLQDDSIPSLPLPYGHGQVAMIKSPDKDHVVHEPMLNKKGMVGARMKKARKIRTDSKGLGVKGKKQEMVDKGARLYGSRGSKVKKATQEKKMMLQKSGQDAMGKATSNDLVKPEAGPLRQEGYTVRKRIMMKMVYGKEVWENLEQEEKQRKVVSSRVLLGSMRSAKRLANSMAVEIVRVAMQRNSKRTFPDNALLSYLVQKSSHLLGKRVTDSLQVVGNGESMVHSLDNSKQGDIFVRSHDGQKYAIVQGSSLNFRPIKSMQTLPKDQSLMSNLTLSHLIRTDICASSAGSAGFYDDCASLQ